jgi:hypothetical protein
MSAGLRIYLLAGVLAFALAWGALRPTVPAARASVTSAICDGLGYFSGGAGKLCGLAAKGVGLAGGVAGPAGKLAGFAAAAAAVWAGTHTALKLTARVIAQVSRPRLQSAWFSASYWRVAAIATLLSVPFLLAAAVQSLLRSDLSLLARAAFGYLPLAMLLVAIAAPLTMLLLAASDEISSFVAAAGAGSADHFLSGVRTAAVLGALAGAPFLAIVFGLLLLAGALALTLELIVREAAVYVVVLMLPLAFAAMVWPARRALAAKLAELLVALILSKFVIVAVLGLAGAGLGQVGHGSVGTMLSSLAVVLLAVFSPLVLLRVIPFTELAAAVGGRHALLAPSREAGQNVLQAQTVDELLAERARRVEPRYGDPLDRGYLPPPPARGEPAGREPAGGELTGGEPAGREPAGGERAGGERVRGERQQPPGAESAPPARMSADGSRVLGDEPWWEDPNALRAEVFDLEDSVGPGAMLSEDAARAAARDAAAGEAPLAREEPAARAGEEPIGEP